MEKKYDLTSLNFDFKGEVISFVQKVNLKVMEAGTSVKYDGNTYIYTNVCIYNL